MSHFSTQTTKQAKIILESYASQLEWTAPERTIHQCRAHFLQHCPEASLADFTEGLRFLLENRYLRRLNDERLELTPQGRAWYEQQSPSE